MAHRDGSFDVLAYDQETLSRNRGLITPEEQAALRAATVLVAGCGSVGGSAVEPLVRLGLMRLRCADPEVYDLSNLNRQVCLLEDVGRPKAEVVARRARDINPNVDVRIYDEGLTEENLDEALSGVSVVFDGIDPEQSGWVKYSMHARAAERGIPVVAGYDYGGKPTLYVFDYRRDRRPFYGRTTAEAHREGRYRDAMRWLGYFHFPADFLPIMRTGLRDGGVWPQVSYCVQGLGAMATRVIVDLLMARRVRRVVSVDLHRATKPYPQAATSMARIPVELLRTLVVANRYSKNGRPAPVVSAHTAVDNLPAPLRTALDAARSAPSRGNAQPWRFAVTPRGVLLAGVAGVGDSAAEAEALIALGCAVEAVDQVADVEWREAPVDAPAGGVIWLLEASLRGLRDDAVQIGQALLGARAANRGGYLPNGVDPAVLACAVRAAAAFDASLDVTDDRAGIQRIAAATAAQVRSNADGDAWSWMPDAVASLPATLRSSGVARRVLAARIERTVRSSGAVLALRARMDTPVARIDAGRALMRAWLTLVEAGYAAAPLPTGAARDADVVCLLRVGRALSAARRSPRKPLAELLVDQPAPEFAVQSPAEVPA